MRLLERTNSGKIRLVHVDDDKVPPYAILSHTWGRDEVLLHEIINGTGENKLGYRKIRFCADQAWRENLKFSWVDTCCIDKCNAVELQEAINRMFRYYREAVKCYVYLDDVPGLSFPSCRWFSRGWTLQELIAPVWVDFFTGEGIYLGSRESLEREIHDVTGIPVEALRGSQISDYSVSERITWMGDRETTKEEDKAYSLFGILNVCMPLLYGEGREKAFQRLRAEVNAVEGPSKQETVAGCEWTAYPLIERFSIWILRFVLTRGSHRHGPLGRPIRAKSKLHRSRIASAGPPHEGLPLGS
jgi:hypothetical protein